MGFIEDELQEVSRLCQNVVEGSRLVCCVQAMVRVEITKTSFKKIIVCIQFPREYPKTPLLVELKSKTLSDNLLGGLTNVCEVECKKILGKAQVLPILRFIRNFVDENSLCCCYDEILTVKKLLGDNDKLQLKQKNSKISLAVCQGAYQFKARITVPEDYPNISVGLGDVDTNLPEVLTRYLIGQANELSRRCVEPPLKKLPNQLPFKPSPSLGTVASFLIRSVKTLPNEHCQLCNDPCLPADPKDAVTDDNADLHVERLYCGHLFHQICLASYMKTPPFHGGKKCPGCGQKVYHHKWGLNERLAEIRWSHEQARARELDEVADFFA